MECAVLPLPVKVTRWTSSNKLVGFKKLPFFEGKEERRFAAAAGLQDMMVVSGEVKARN
jgi:hypothetical protein